VSVWDTLDPRYRLILCDVWGVIHDGVTLYPGAEERLRQWRNEGRCVVLITNAPRTAEAVEQQLARIGLAHDAFDFVATSGEAGIEALNALEKPVGFVGTATDREILEGRGVHIADGENFSELACTGTMVGRPDPSDYRVDLERWADHRKVPQIAFKPPGRGAKAAPFKRKDAMLEALPIGVLVAPGSGIQANLADKARRLGLPVWKLGHSGA